MRAFGGSPPRIWVPRGRGRAASLAPGAPVGEATPSPKLLLSSSRCQRGRIGALRCFRAAVLAVRGSAASRGAAPGSREPLFCSGIAGRPDPMLSPCPARAGRSGTAAPGTRPLLTRAVLFLPSPRSEDPAPGEVCGVDFVPPARLRSVPGMAAFPLAAPRWRFSRPSAAMSARCLKLG